MTITESAITEKQKVFIESYADALAEKSEKHALGVYSLSVITMSLENVGILYETPAFFEAINIFLEHPEIKFDLPSSGRGAVASFVREVQVKSKRGFVYVLVNDSFPDLVKIGYTTQSEVGLRVKQLSSATGVPTPFQAIYSIESERPIELEALVHKRLANYRIQTKEFFRCSVDQAVEACELCVIDMGEDK